MSTSKQLERHSLSAGWPDIPASQFAELKTDIQKHGQRYPITIYVGQIIDGWHRYQACAQLGIKPKTEVFRGSAQAAAELVVSLNAHRRNLTEGQRAFSVTGCYAWVEAQGGVSQDTPPSSNTEKSGKSAPEKTNREMATLAGTSEATIHRAKRVHQSGSKALKNAVTAGKVPLAKAAAVVDLPKSAQLEAATQKPEQKSAQVTPAPDFDFTDYEPENDEDYKKNIENVMMADDKLAAMREELKQVRRELQAMKSSRDHYQNEAGAAVRLVNKRDREVEKLKKELTKAQEKNESLQERIAIMEAA